MRSEENPLDLNNLPEDYNKDGKQVLEDTSSFPGYRKKKSGAMEGKEECGMVYECRFCSLKFCKSQALGGHMNRHRQERETETLNRARQLVFNNDPLLGQGPIPHHHHLGSSISHGGYQHQTGDPTMPFRSLYPTSRLFSGSTTATLLPSTPPPTQPYMYTPFTSHYPVAANNNHDYFLFHVVPSNATTTNNSNNYTCIGAPVISPPPHLHHHHHGFSNYGSNADGCGEGNGGREMSVYNHDHHQGGLSWGRNCTAVGTTTQQKRLDPSSINRFQDGF